MSFVSGDRVTTFVARIKVLIGSVCKVYPNACCSNVLIERDNVLLLILLCCEKNVLLPFLAMNALRMEIFLIAL